jgi:hypothetical protein
MAQLAVAFRNFANAPKLAISEHSTLVILDEEGFASYFFDIEHFSGKMILYPYFSFPINTIIPFIRNRIT